jgi:hypothetical protein
VVVDEDGGWLGSCGAGGTEKSARSRVAMSRSAARESLPVGVVLGWASGLGEWWTRWNGRVRWAKEVSIIRERRAKERVGGRRGGF